MELTISRPELDAKLETTEARADARVARIEGKMDQMLLRLDNTDRGLSNLRWWILGAALSILVASVGTAIGIQQMTLTTFQAAARPQAPPP